MFRSILVGLLVAVAAVVGYITFDWYRKQNAGEPYGAPLLSVSVNGAPNGSPPKRAR